MAAGFCVRVLLLSLLVLEPDANALSYKSGAIKPLFEPAEDLDDSYKPVSAPYRAGEVYGVSGGFDRPRKPLIAPGTPYINKSKYPQTPVASKSSFYSGSREVDGYIQDRSISSALGSPVGQKIRQDAHRPNSYGQSFPGPRAGIATSQNGRLEMGIASSHGIEIHSKHKPEFSPWPGWNNDPRNLPPWGLSRPSQQPPLEGSTHRPLPTQGGISSYAPGSLELQYPQPANHQPHLNVRGVLQTKGLQRDFAQSKPVSSVGPGFLVFQRPSQDPQQDYQYPSALQLPSQVAQLFESHPSLGHQFSVGQPSTKPRPAQGEPSEAQLTTESQGHSSLRFLRPLPPKVHSPPRPLPPKVGSPPRPLPPKVRSPPRPLPQKVGSPPRPLPPKIGSPPRPLPPKVGSPPRPLPPKVGSPPRPLPPKVGSPPRPLPPKGGSPPRPLPPKGGSPPRPLPPKGSSWPRPPMPLDGSWTRPLPPQQVHQHPSAPQLLSRAAQLVKPHPSLGHQSSTNMKLSSAQAKPSEAKLSNYSQPPRAPGRVSGYRSGFLIRQNKQTQKRSHLPNPGVNDIPRPKAGMWDFSPAQKENGLKKDNLSSGHRPKPQVKFASSGSPIQGPPNTTPGGSSDRLTGNKRLT